MEKEVLDQFIGQLKIHPVEFAGKSKKDDWYIVETTDEFLVLLNGQGRVLGYTRQLFQRNMECKYTEDYILLAGTLYQMPEKAQIQLKKQQINYDFCEMDVKDIFYYEGTGLSQIVLNDKTSIFVYKRKPIKNGLISYFMLPSYSVKEACWDNGIMRLETTEENYYMSISKRRFYSEKSRKGKKLKKIFFTNVE